MDKKAWLRQSGASATPRRVKLCQIITQTHFGGAQRYVCDIVNNLGNNFDIVIAYGDGDEKEIAQYIKNNMIKFHKFKYLKRKINIFYDILALFELYSFFVKNKFDVIHLHSSKAGFIASLSCRCANIKKIIYTAHGWVFKENISLLKKYFYLFLEKFSANFKTKIICVSKDDYNLALKNKICKKEKLELIYNGFERKKPLDKQLAREYVFEKINQKDNNQIIIGTVANLYKNKGIDVLIRASELLNKEYSNLIFVVFGSGPEEQNLNDLIKKLGMKNFYLPGIIKDKYDSYKYFSAFDIFTICSRKEGLPYTLLEALNAQISIVCSNLESLTEVIENNVNGAIFEAKNSADLSNKIELLFTNHELASNLIKNGPKSLEKFDFSNFISKIKRSYLE